MFMWTAVFPIIADDKTPEPLENDDCTDQKSQSKSKWISSCLRCGYMHKVLRILEWNGQKSHGLLLGATLGISR